MTAGVRINMKPFQKIIDFKMTAFRKNKIKINKQNDRVWASKMWTVRIILDLKANIK